MKKKKILTPQSVSMAFALFASLLATIACSDDLQKTSQAKSQQKPEAPQHVASTAAKAYAVAEESSMTPVAVITDLAADSSGESIIETLVDSDEIVYDESVDYSRSGREAWERGDYERAVTELEIAHDLGQARDYDTYLLGLACRRTGEVEAAEMWLSEAVRKSPNFAKAQINLARARIVLGDLEGADDAIESALEIDDSSAQALNVKGRILLARGDRDAAFETFRKAAELDPTNPWPLNNLGYAYLIAGDAEVATIALDQAVQIDPDFALAWHNLALAREKTGALAAASYAATRAEEIDSASSTYRATATRLIALAPIEAEPMLPQSETEVAVLPSTPVVEETSKLNVDDHQQ